MAVAGDAAALCVAGVALDDIHLRFTWQAWHLATCAFASRGRRGTYGTGTALVARLGWDHSPMTPWLFAWQAWHLATSTFVSRGRRGTWRHPPLFHVAGVALMALGSPVTPWHFAWQAWHLPTCTFVSRGRRGTWRHVPSLHVAGVALMALGWLWWRAWAGISRR